MSVVRIGALSGSHSSTIVVTRPDTGRGWTSRGAPGRCKKEGADALPDLGSSLFYVPRLGIGGRRMCLVVGLFLEHNFLSSLRNESLRLGLSDSKTPTNSTVVLGRID